MDTGVERCEAERGKIAEWPPMSFLPYLDRSEVLKHLASSLATG
jgi:hypothetical protein